MLARLWARAGTLPARIELAGFIERPGAAEQAVLDALRARGVELQPLAPPAVSAQVHRHRLPDEAAQWRWVAQQLQLALQPCVQTGQRPPRLLLVLPDPDAAREPLEAALRDALLPTPGDDDDTPALPPWRWARGRPLAEQPLVDSLLAALQLQAERNAPALVSRVLLSGALWSQAQRAQTSAIDARLRDAGRPFLLSAANVYERELTLRNLRTMLGSAPAMNVSFALSPFYTPCEKIANMMQNHLPMGMAPPGGLPSGMQAQMARTGLEMKFGTYLDETAKRQPEFQSVLGKFGWSSHIILLTPAVPSVS